MARAYLAETGIRLERAIRERNDFISRLWVGNGTGAVVSVTLIAGAAKSGFPVHRWYLSAPSSFVAGLLVLALGYLVSMSYAAGWLHSSRMTEAQRKAVEANEPVLEAADAARAEGVHPFSEMTIAALISGICFMSGVSALSLAMATALPT